LVKNFDYMREYRILSRDGQTDRQTDRQTDSLRQSDPCYAYLFNRNYVIEE